MPDEVESDGAENSAESADSQDASRSQKTATDGSDRRKRDALVSVWVPIIVAVVALGGVGVGSWVQSINNDANIRAAGDQKLQEFRREERQAAYVDILKAATELENASSNAEHQLQAIFTSPETNSLLKSLGEKAFLQSQVEPVEREWRQHYNFMAATVQNAELPSTKRAYELALALQYSFLFEFGDKVTSFAANSNNHRLSELASAKFWYVPPLLDDADLIKKPTYELRDLFVNEAKNNLAFDDQ